MKNIIVYLILAFLLSVNVCYAAQTEVDYDITYNILTDITGVHINTSYALYNGSASQQHLYLIAAAFKNGKLSKMNMVQANVDAGCYENVSHTLTLNSFEQRYQVKLYVWDCSTLQPIGEFETVDELHNYIRTKDIICTCNEGEEIEVYISSYNAKASASDVSHSVIYDPEKLKPTDFCAFTYEKELSTGKIPGTDICITAWEKEMGIIDFECDFQSGNTTGIVNSLKFKALDDLNDEKITLIQ